MKKYGSGTPKRSGQLEARSDIPSNLLLGEAITSKSVVKQFLPKVPQLRSDHSYEKKSAKVLTSTENRKQIEEKERQEQEKLDEKERRKEQRELQRIKRQEEIQRKKQEKEKREKEKQERMAEKK